MTDVVLVSLGSTGGWRAPTRARRAMRARGARRVVATADAAARRAHVRADRPALGARGARGGAARDRRARAARDRLLHDDRRAARGRGRARSASTPWRATTAPGVTASGSARSSAGGCAQAPLLRADDAADQPRASACAIPVEPQRRGRRARHRRGHLRRRPGQEGARPLLAAWDAARAARRGARRDGHRPRTARDGVRFAGRLAAAEFRALLRRARVFVAAPAREDYGIAQLEALADGCVAGDDAGARAVRRAADRPRARPAARRATTSRTALRVGARRPAARLRGARAARRSRRSAATRSTRVVADELLPRLLRLTRRALAQRRELPPTAACWRRRPAVSQARRAVATPQRVLPQRVDAVGVGVDRGSARRPAPAARAWTSLRSRRSGAELISSIVPVRAAASKTRVDVERVGRARLDLAAGRVADRVDPAGARWRRPCARSSRRSDIAERRVDASRSTQSSSASRSSS